MVAIHVGKLHTAKELLLGQMLGDVGQVKGSLPVVALIQVIFVLEDFLGREGQGSATSPACRAQFSPRHPTTHSSPWPHRQPCLSPKELQVSQELAAGSPGSRTAGEKSSHTAKQGVLGFKLSLQASLGSKGRLPASKHLPPCNTVLGAGTEVKLGTKPDSMHLPGNVQSRQRKGRS